MLSILDKGTRLSVNSPAELPSASFSRSVCHSGESLRDPLSVPRSFFEPPPDTHQPVVLLFVWRNVRPTLMHRNIPGMARGTEASPAYQRDAC